MNLRTLVYTLLIAAVVAGGFYYTRDPHRTALPFGSTDLSGVQRELARLPADERALVEAYVTRSNGDVLPAKFADPDDPLTARTFGEAIELQRRWEKRQAEIDAKVAQVHAVQESRIDPLRAVASAEVVKAEIVTRNEFQARRNPNFYKQPYRVDTSPTFLVRIRIKNLGNEAVVALKGSLQARDKEAVLPMDLCWIDLSNREPLPPGGSLELDCGNEHRGAGPQQQAFVEDPPGRFRVEWQPKYLKLASGRELDSGL